MFIESHMHISLNGDNAPLLRKQIVDGTINLDDYIRSIILAYKSRGILAIRDGGDPLYLHDMVRRIAKEEGVIYKTPIHAIYKKGYYGSLIGKSINDLFDFKNLMNKILPYKPDFIKIPLTGMMNFDVYGDTGDIAFTQNELEYIINYAFDKELPVMVHVNSSKGVRMAIKAKANTIEHGYFMESEDLYELKESKTIWVPTLAPLGNIIYSNDHRFKSQLPVIRRIFDEQCHRIYEAYNTGVKIAVGSDSGAYKVYHGSGFFDELIYMNKAGIKKQQLIELSYKNGLKSLNISEKEINYLNENIKDEN